MATDIFNTPLQNDGATIEPSAFAQNGVHLGKDAVVGEGARLYPGVNIKPNVHVPSNSFGIAIPTTKILFEMFDILFKGKAEDQG